MITSLMSQRMRAGTVALAACLLGAAAGTASAATSTADDSADVRTMRVSYGDLNLATEQGSRALHTRLESAARAVCAPEDGRNLAEVAAARACEARAIAQAVKDVHSPMLAANRVQG
ncbi:MAG TPA: UrcA family protein [Steroidobacteraceae bacterium]|jgi:UrcA family protein|nr:UrcA family protein [Steroidobacteraceae bacterium]